MPGMTQILVSGQQTSPFPHAPVSSLQDFLVGVRHALASGQQYSVALHTGFDSPAPTHCTSMWKSPAEPSAQMAMAVISPRNLAFGHTSGCSVEQQTCCLPSGSFVLHSPVKSLQSYEKESNGTLTTCKSRCQVLICDRSNVKPANQCPGPRNQP